MRWLWRKYAAPSAREVHDAIERFDFDRADELMRQGYHANIWRIRTLAIFGSCFLGWYALQIVLALQAHETFNLSHVAFMFCVVIWLLSLFNLARAEAATRRGLAWIETQAAARRQMQPQFDAAIRERKEEQ
jgi:hypothetical protein